MENKAAIIMATSIICLALVFSAGCAEKVVDQESSAIKEETGSQISETGENYRVVTDMRGKEVKVPKDIQRVVTVSDGLIEGVMTVLGEEEAIVGVGSSCIQRVFVYEYETASGENYTYKEGMNPVTYLNPWIRDLPLIAQSGRAMNYETLASLNPDVVIIRLGSCTLRSADDEGVIKTIETIESLGIPLIVLYGPPCYEDPDISKISREICIIGQVFGKEDQAIELAKYLESVIEMVKERTKDIYESEKPEVLMFGLSPKSRDAGGAGTVCGIDTIESYFIEDMVNAKNAYKGAGSRYKGTGEILSTEQVLALNPDVIVLPTYSGYHPPSELYTAPYYQNLQELDAVKNKRVLSLPWSPCNCAKRLEYPIDIMVIAKAAYPERFDDIDLSEWLLEFYLNVYGVNVTTAEKLRSAQWMDWTLETDVCCE
ncbi:MAG: ABC transporter substrate-binding protein [Halobacteriota archaeon]|nr:ABC transporter substrate-binding protein [Halobacteriota archaeon]